MVVFIGMLISAALLMAAAIARDIYKHYKNKKLQKQKRNERQKTKAA